MPFGYDSGFDLADLGSLTEVGVSAAQKTTGVHLTFQVSVSNIGTDVTVRLEGSLDGDNYFNLNAGEADITITANGTTGYFLVAPVAYARFRLVSFNGGSPAVACKIGTI